jgi:membrane fusion protein, heavy metal efflux system
MTSTTTRLLAAIIVGSLALSAWGVWYLGIPLVAAQKKAQDTPQHDEQGHTEKPKTRGAREQTKAQNKAKGQAQEAHKHDEHEEEKIIRLPEAKRKELGIEVATAQPGSLQTQLALTGTVSVNTDRFVRIVSRIPGVVREVRKNLGDSVRAGEVMAVIDSRELADAKGAYLAATERVTLTADTFQREKDLWEKKISPAEDYLKAKQAHTEARIELRLAKQKLIALGFADAALKQLASEPEALLHAL